VVGTAYNRLYNLLHDQILSGRFKPGDKLPPERELCDTFGVSRITCRHALSLLQDQGLVERFPGRGTFITRIHPHKVPILDGDYPGSMLRGAPNIRRKLLMRAEVDPPPHIQELLGLLKTERSLLIERLDLQGEEPLSFDRGYFPLNRARTIDSTLAVQVDFLEQWAEREPVDYSYTRVSVEAIEADAIAHERLAVPLKSPMLLESDVVYTKDGKAVAVFETVYRGDRFKLVSTKVR
jgi:GntR family transcriptional regulator